MYVRKVTEISDVWWQHSILEKDLNTALRPADHLGHSPRGRRHKNLQYLEHLWIGSLVLDLVSEKDNIQINRGAKIQEKNYKCNFLEEGNHLQLSI